MPAFIKWFIATLFICGSTFANETIFETESNLKSPLGKITINDPILGNRTVTYERINTFAVTEGDILIGRVTNINQHTAIIIPPTLAGGLWETSTIPYELADDLPAVTLLSIRQAISYWQHNTSINFVERTASNLETYPDYIHFIEAKGTTCSSYVGRHGGEQEINLSRRCTTMNIVHEIGHALGLWHEQSRADRDHYIRILWENIEDDHQYNFEQHLTDGRDFGEYDFQSIMHYGAYAFSKNGRNTIEPLIDGVIIGQRNQLSEKDKAAISAMYNK